MDTAKRQALDDFFRQHEQQAFQMAFALIHDRQDALDLVQESMLKLVLNYKDKDALQWAPLFYRIVQNKVRDWYRKQRFKSLFTRLLPQADGADEITHEVDINYYREQQGPEQLSLNSCNIERIKQALKSLPLRQQQTFLMRAWQEFDTRETAFALSISESSVKTHYARATRQLRQLLGDLDA